MSKAANPADSRQAIAAQIVTRFVCNGALIALLALCAVSVKAAEPPSELTPQHQAKLVRMVRQDCGACHGLRLTGGLGPAITPQALSGLTPEVVMIFILYGRSGTPMPNWNAMLSETEARWIAERLLAGFPEEP